MKKLIIYPLLVALIIQSTAQLWIMASFYFQRDYIAKNICVNRFDKESTCKGHCYLTKQLKKNEEKEQQLPNIKSKQMDWVVSSSLKIYFLPINIFSSQIVNTKEFTIISSDFIFSVFHPPRVI